MSKIIVKPVVMETIADVANKCVDLARDNEEVYLSFHDITFKVFKEDTKGRLIYIYKNKLKEVKG